MSEGIEGKKEARLANKRTKDEQNDGDDNNNKEEQLQQLPPPEKTVGGGGGGAGAKRVSSARVAALLAESSAFAGETSLEGIGNPKGHFSSTFKSFVARTYVENLVETLTIDNIDSTLAEVNQLSTASSTVVAGPHTSGIGVTVHFASLILISVLKDIRDIGLLDFKKQSQEDIRVKAIRRQVLTLIEQSSGEGLVTVLCEVLTSLAEGAKGHGRTLSDHLEELVVGEEGKVGEQVFTASQGTVFTAAASVGRFPTEFEGADEAGIKNLTKSVSERAAEILLNQLEVTWLPNLTDFYSSFSPQAIQFIVSSLETHAASSSNPTIRIRADKASKSLSKMDGAVNDSGDSSTNKNEGLTDRLGPSSTDSSIGLTNILADMGPACTGNTLVLRDTLFEITRSLPSFSNGWGGGSNNGSEGKGVLDEAAVARLIWFFGERGTSKRGKDGTGRDGNSISSALVGTLTNDGDRGGDGGVGTWDLDVVCSYLGEDYEHLDWTNVAKKFDFHEFSVRDEDHFGAILVLFRSGAKFNLPLSSVVSDWKNHSGQLSFLENALSVPPSVYSFPVNEAEILDASSVEGSSSSCPNPRGWASADVLQRLLILSDVPELARRVRDLFVRGLLSCPEVLLCSLVRLQLSVASAAQKGGNSPESGALAAYANAGMQMKGELMRELIPLFFKPNPHHRVQNGPNALRRLWSISPNTVAAACIEAWRSTASDTPQLRLATIVHVISIIRLLPSTENATSSILNGNKDHEFSIAIGFIMADNEMLQLRPWLTDRASPNGGGKVFIITLVAYLGKLFSTAIPRGANNNNGGNSTLVSMENLTVSLLFLESLDNAILNEEIPSTLAPIAGSSSIGVKIGDSVKALVEACLSAHPSLNGVVSQPSVAPALSGGGHTTQPTSSGTPDDIEEAANSYFQKIYTSEQSIVEVVEMLKRFKTSGNAKENDIYACMIHNLFDEYRFFSKYPEKELRITGILFGMLIQHQLVSSITLGIALRYVLEALRKPPSPGTTTSNSGKMFRFGMFSLEQFKERLHEWPQYCSHIVQIPHLREGYADLVAEIEGAMAESQNRASTGSAAAPANPNDGSVSEAMSQGGPRSGDDSESKVVNGDGDKASTEDVNRTEDGGGESSRAEVLPNGFNNSAKESSRATPNMELTPPALPLTKQPEQPAVAVFGPRLGRAVTGQSDSSEAQHEAPPDAMLDRVQFLINNVSPSNVEPKAQELKDMLAPQYFGWLGHYLVVKRISTQPNFHSLYLAFLDQLGEYGKGLVEAILSSVYLNVGKLLRSPKITTSTSERSLLKNLGSWLGQITLARNRPILQIMLDCKELLFQGYETGMLIAVTPFVAKILEGAKNSVVFRPPNPWLMGLLSVFRALYGVDDLKMNIKFEVEVLCKNLGVKLEDIPCRTEDLAKRIPPVKERNPDFNMKSSMMSQPPGVAASVPTAHAQSSGVSQRATSNNSASGLPSPDEKQSPAVMTNAAASGMAGATGSEPGRNQFNAVPSVPQVASGSSSVGTSQDQQTVIPNLAAYVSVNPNLSQIFQQYHGGTLSSTLSTAVLKRSVPVAVDRAIRDIIQPVVERSVTIACITTKEIVTKDFAMEGDEKKMRKAAQLMVANLAGSLALVTCREPLRTSVSTHLRQLLMSNINNSSGGSNSSSNPQLSEQEHNIVEQCVAVCSADNLELGCMLIEKAATEKAVLDMDENLSPAFNARKKHREQTGQPFYDMSIFGGGNQRYPAALPEPLRPKPGGLRNDQLLVYEAFQRIPRQPSMLPNQQQGMKGNSGAALPGQQKINVEALSSIAGKLDNAVSNLLSAAGGRAPEITLAMLRPDHEVKQLLVAAQRATSATSTQGNSRMLNSAESDAVLGFAQGIFKRLYELSLTEPLRLEALIALLETLNDCCPQLSQDLGTWATYAPTETEGQRKLHRTILLLLVRSRLIHVPELDAFLARSTDGGRNIVWVEFNLLFVRTAVLERIASSTDFPKVMEVLTNIAEGRGQYSQQIVQNYQKPILRLLEELHSVSGNMEVHGRLSGENQTSPASNAHVSRSDKQTHEQSSSISAVSLNNLAEATKRAAEAVDAMSRDDPPGMKQQVTFLLDNWLRLHSESLSNEKSLQYVQLLQQHGIGKVDDHTERFFRFSTDLVVEVVLKNASSPDSGSKDGPLTQGKPLNYGVIDAYCKLVSLLIRYMNGGGSNDQIANQRISLLNKVLGITVRSMMSSYERSRREHNGVVSHWDQRPWFRLLLNLVIDLNSPSPSLDPISLGILSVFGSAFHVVQPLVIPGFSFAWLELVSHRMFLSNLLLRKGQKGWEVAHQLLIDLFLFLEPHLRKTELTDAVKHLYKGTLRVLLVLLHDFPAFLAGYHLSFCNVIPENCVQLRNLILSAFPRGMVLPDPFTPNLKIDLLPEISQSPVVHSNVVGPLAAIRSDLDSFLKARQPADFVNGLLSRLCKDGTNEVDAPRVNSLVLYVGMQAMVRLQNAQMAHTLSPHTPEMEIIQKLMDFDDRGRYISLNAIANQLRYPSSHTHYYSCVMLFLFSEAKDEGIKEQVTRVLLERLIVHRPHPWGLLITFIELIKNQRYQFWSHPFTRCATEIEKVFESVARSCMTPASQRSAAAGGGDVSH